MSFVPRTYVLIGCLLLLSQLLLPAWFACAMSFMSYGLLVVVVVVLLLLPLLPQMVGMVQWLV